MYIYLNLPHDLAQMLFPTYMYIWEKYMVANEILYLRYIRVHGNKAQCNYES